MCHEIEKLHAGVRPYLMHQHARVHPRAAGTKPDDDAPQPIALIHVEESPFDRKSVGRDGRLFVRAPRRQTELRDPADQLLRHGLRRLAADLAQALLRGHVTLGFHELMNDALVFDDLRRTDGKRVHQDLRGTRQPKLFGFRHWLHHRLRAAGKANHARDDH